MASEQIFVRNHGTYSINKRVDQVQKSGLNSANLYVSALSPSLSNKLWEEMAM